MKGLDMMLANLIGIKPEDMRAQVQQALDLMSSGASAMAKLQADVNAIKKHLGITDDPQETINNGRAIAERGNSTNGNHIQL
jgi:hypothetical protein